MDLKEYRMQLGKLSLNEQKLRDLYLRDMALGKIQGPPTCYPSLNKRNLAFYDEDDPTFVPHPDNITKSFEENNKDKMDCVALEYIRNKITYKEFIDNKNAIVKSLVHNNISQDNGLSLWTLAIPETMYILYALGHINAVGNFFPIWLDYDTMVQDLIASKSKILVVLDKLLEIERIHHIIDNGIKNHYIEKVVIIPASYSAFKNNLMQKIGKKKKYGKEFIYWEEFLKEGKDETLPPISDYIPNLPIATVYSSGSTGIAKGILLSHESLLLPSQTYKTLGFDLSPGQKFYQSIPTSASTGLIALGTSPLNHGSIIFQDPRLQPKLYIKNIGKRKINWAVATIGLYNNGIEQLSSNPIFKLMNKLGVYSYDQLTHILIGGTAISDKNKDALSRSFAEVGGKVPVEDSYGTCENAGIISFEGIPLPGVDIRILDEKGNELYYNERGFISFNSPFRMLRYLSRDDLNQIVQVKGVDDVHISEKCGYVVMEDGEKMLITGDIGYFTDDNKLVISGRAKDYSIINNKKVYNFDVANAIRKEPLVTDCEVFSNKDTNGDEYLCVHMTLEKNNENEETILKRVQQIIFSELDDIDFVPKYFKIRDSFPIAINTKKDFNLLKEEKNYTFIDSSYLISHYTKRLEK